MGCTPPGCRGARPGARRSKGSGGTLRGVHRRGVCQKTKPENFGGVPENVWWGSRPETRRSKGSAGTLRGVHRGVLRGVPPDPLLGLVSARVPRQILRMSRRGNGTPHKRKRKKVGGVNSRGNGVRRADARRRQGCGETLRGVTRGVNGCEGGPLAGPRFRPGAPPNCEIIQ